ncbi:pyruvate kinase [Ameyamaea chiangmaiensis NBRC 103196]|uniref:Pyruvate kinase n=1 Tax=Ameyamaea chiangmaiensis TaxID=442969 RepID=A0A850PGQ8_9PROT|nr:pyruvate kinase [Ameyamaea chiangmaiensis]MBS4074239.1 pyruvate kinase [Ameyamaea chiangmaiensis]NVN41839.1 pyruvate kinase [Ameyamaea chiangmaiensis]GBQ71349.1 pyruvate kinase [Ameyamaea chiangmaiensis NBRC 103196]
MTPTITSRLRRTKIVSTLGPASSDIAVIRKLALAGVDVFRLNFSHGAHADHAARHEAIRAVESEIGRPIAILADVQGPKLRVGVFADGKVELRPGAKFRLDLNDAPGTVDRVRLPHPEIISAARVGSNLLLDDGKLRLVVVATGPDYLETEVVVGGWLSERKGVNVPDIVLPIPALTEKDRRDLDFALELGVEYIGLSFVQRPEDVEEAKAIARGRAWIMTKLEKPQAMDNLEAILELSDAVMVARGDLGVELPPELVPLAQKRIIRLARQLGKPVIVATQMLESMITAPTPTRAEASDVATAVFDGADAVMLSAETAAGQYPLEAVGIMARIISTVEQDAGWQSQMQASRPRAEAYVADAIAAAATSVADALGARAIAAFTLSGTTALRIARERPACPIVGLAPEDEVARRLSVVWGVRAQSLGQETPVHTIEDVVGQASEAAVSDGLARTGDQIVIAAGLPFGVPGSTNTLRVFTVT